MNAILYRIWFEKGGLRSIYANDPVQAVILAQAEAIRAGLDFAVSDLRDEETGQIYTTTSPKVENYTDEQTT